MKSIITLFLAIMAFQANAQEISGKVVNEIGQPLVIATILVKQNGVLKGGACTDYNGYYSVKPLDAGSYDVTTYYGCQDTITVTKLIVTAGEKTIQNFSLTQSATTPKHTIIPYKKLISGDLHKTTTDDLKLVRVPKIDRLLPLLPYHNSRGRRVNIGGCRGKILYIIDCVPVSTNLIPPSCTYKYPIDYNTPTSFKLTEKEIKSLPTIDIHDMIALAPSVYQSKRGADINIGGAQTDGTLYIVDGMQIARR